MKLITRDTDYAIRALILISESKKTFLSTTTIQQELDLPRPFLRKILQILQKSGVLKSIKGNKGGFLLAVSPKNISIADLIEIFQGKITLSDCFLKKEICPEIGTCNIRKKIKNIEAGVVSNLQKITIASLLKCR